jgi:hypothetical protein
MREEIKNQTVNLSGQDLFGLSVDTAVLFSNHKNIYKRSVEKRQPTPEQILSLWIRR